MSEANVKRLKNTIERVNRIYRRKHDELEDLISGPRARPKRAIKLLDEVFVARHNVKTAYNDFALAVKTPEAIEAARKDFQMFEETFQTEELATRAKEYAHNPALGIENPNQSTFVSPIRNQYPHVFEDEEDSEDENDKKYKEAVREMQEDLESRHLAISARQQEAESRLKADYEKRFGEYEKELEELKSIATGAEMEKVLLEEELRNAERSESIEQQEMATVIEKQRKEIEDLKLQIRGQEMQRELQEIELISQRTCVPGPLGQEQLQRTPDRQRQETIQPTPGPLGQERFEQSAVSSHLLQPRARDVFSPERRRVVRANDAILPINLPKIRLDVFEGDPLQWPEWSGLFKVMIHDTSLDQNSKMYYLKSFTGGKAKQVINGLGYDGNYYNQAWRALERQFGLPHIIVDAQLNKVTSFPPIRKHDSANIIKFSNIVTNFVNVLHNNNYVGDLKSVTNLNIILNKFPPDLREKWHHYAIDNGILQPSITRVSDWLKDEAMAHERMLAKRTGELKPKPSSSKSFLITSTDMSDKKPGISDFVCHVCKKGSHRVWRCPDFRNKTVKERYEIARKCNLCFLCLDTGHASKDCKMSACKIDDCKKKHNHLLHLKKGPFQANKSGGSLAQNVTEVPNSESNASTVSKVASGLLPIVAVELANTDYTCTIKTFALLDTGSTSTFIDKTLSARLGLTGQKLETNLSGINSESHLKTEVVQLFVKNEDEQYTKIEAMVHPSIALGEKSYSFRDLKKRYDHLSVLSDQNIRNADVKIIIGQDHFELMRPIEYRRNKNQPKEPWAVKSKLGWSLSGPLPQQDAQACTFFACTEDADFKKQVGDWWKIETYGSSHNKKEVFSLENQKAMDILEKTTKKVGNRYEVGMLWTESEPKMANNYGQALGALRSLQKKLSDNKELEQKYTASVQKDLDASYVRKIGQHELNETRNETQWYLPHHPVFHPHKPDKLRRVCNAAAKYQGYSLNDKLMAGPDLLQNLIGTLFRFREKSIAITADIESMFLQVLVPPRDSKCLRFLYKDLQNEQKIAVYEYTRHIFGAKSSPTCANFAVKKALIDGDCEELVRNFYMDDFIFSATSVENAIATKNKVVHALAEGGFKLTKFTSNCTNLSDEDQTENKISVLGMNWNLIEDNLIVCRIKDDIEEQISQRMLLSIIASVFDPLGIISPFVIRMRNLLKNLWTIQGINWDEIIPDEYRLEFLTWRNELPLLKELKIPRKYSNNAEAELHVFADASLYGLCVVAYLKITENNQPSLSYVIGKTRVAPKKQLSVPRLELQSALIAARIMNNILIEHSISIKSIVMWTDSTTVLCWLKSTKKLPVFVANRKSEILEYTNLNMWKHVKTDMNPADLGTRGLTLQELLESAWLTGPTWLLDKEKWPDQPDLETALTEDNIVQNTSLVANASENVFEFERFSNFHRLQNAVAYVLRVIRRKREPTLTISVQEKLEANACIFQIAQKQDFNDYYKALSKMKKPPIDKQLDQLSPFVDTNGLMRARGRLAKSDDLPFCTKHPIILQAKNYVVRLLLRSEHIMHNHVGIEQLRSQLQSTYYIIGVRNALRSVKYNCVICRKQRAKTSSPMMADLPAERLDFSRPFNNTGIDYFGPFQVKVKRSVEKRWICLFTCLTTRAVHLEVARDLSTQSCLNAIHRFIARRGKPSTIISDNGTNFVGSKAYFDEQSQHWQPAIEEKLTKHYIQWKFNPPNAPHFGGVWERLVRSCKQIMMRMVASQVLSEDLLHTTICLIEHSLNQRPLTPVSNDIDDFKAITPNDFLLGPARGNDFAVTPSHVCFKTNLQNCHTYAESVWKRLMKEYTPLQNVRSKWQRDKDFNLQSGQLVWIIEPNVFSDKFLLGRIVQTYEGKDGIVRSADIKTKLGIYKRPIVKLVPVMETFDPLG